MCILQIMSKDFNSEANTESHEKSRTSLIFESIEDESTSHTQQIDKVEAAKNEQTVKNTGPQVMLLPWEIWISSKSLILSRRQWLWFFNLLMLVCTLMFQMIAWKQYFWISKSSMQLLEIIFSLSKTLTHFLCHDFRFIVRRCNSFVLI